MHVACHMIEHPHTSKIPELDSTTGSCSVGVEEMKSRDDARKGSQPSAKAIGRHPCTFKCGTNGLLAHRSRGYKEHVPSQGAVCRPTHFRLLSLMFSKGSKGT